MNPFHKDTPFSDSFRKTTIMGSPDAGWALPDSPEEIREILERLHPISSWTFEDGDGVGDPLYRFSGHAAFGTESFEFEGLYTTGATPGFFFETYTPRQVWALTLMLSQRFPVHAEFVVCFDEFRCLVFKVTTDEVAALKSMADDFDLPISKALYPLNFPGSE